MLGVFTAAVMGLANVGLEDEDGESDGDWYEMPSYSERSRRASMSTLPWAEADIFAFRGVITAMGMNQTGSEGSCLSGCGRSV